MIIGFKSAHVNSHHANFGDFILKLVRRKFGVLTARVISVSPPTKLIRLKKVHDT
jgi:hypothetical protein